MCICVQDVEGHAVRIIGNILTMAERLDDEFTKLLQHTDAHSTDYVTMYATFRFHVQCNSCYVHS